VSVQERCMACAKLTIGSEIVLDAPNGTPRLRGSSGSLFRPVWRLVILTQNRYKVCVERTIGSNIVLDAPEGTPR
jgi:hypothetical protein